MKKILFVVMLMLGTLAVSAQRGSLTPETGLEVHRWVMNVGYDVSLGKEWKGDSAGLNYQTVSLSVGYKFKLGK